jgi:hypothetical protein
MTPNNRQIPNPKAVPIDFQNSKFRGPKIQARQNPFPVRINEKMGPALNAAMSNRRCRFRRGAAVSS